MAKRHPKNPPKSKGPNRGAPGVEAATLVTGKPLPGVTKPSPSGTATTLAVAGQKATNTSTKKPRLSNAELREALARERGKTAGRREALQVAKDLSTAGMTETERATHKAKLSDQREELSGFRGARQEAAERNQLPHERREDPKEAPTYTSKEPPKIPLHEDKNQSLAAIFGDRQKPVTPKTSKLKRNQPSGASLIENLAYRIGGQATVGRR